MSRRNERSAQPNLSPLDAIAAAHVIDGTIWALLETAPIMAAELDSAEPLERRISPGGSPLLSRHMRFTDEEWERMSLEHVGRNSRYGNEHSGRGVPAGPMSRTDGIPPSPSVRGGGSRSFSR